jgi:hypothetical protein
LRSVGYKFIKETYIDGVEQRGVYQGHEALQVFPTPASKNRVRDACSDEPKPKTPRSALYSIWAIPGPCLVLHRADHCSPRVRACGKNSRRSILWERAGHCGGKPLGDGRARMRVERRPQDKHG